MIITLFLTATTATELLCDTASKPVPWEHLGPAGYDDGEGSMISVASSGAAQAAVHVKRYKLAPRDRKRRHLENRRRDRVARAHLETGAR